MPFKSINTISDATGIQVVCSETRLRGVQVYEEIDTGLRVVLADVDGPVVHGYFALATESLCDDGCPHTLEHLIFLGSETYPYKGVLDELANRNQSQGTNAWTDTDHTCYTISTVGKDGFLNLLPVYVDHILFPTLTDTGYVTEVHHITKEGTDAGVVYCEMQARETTGSSKCYRQLLQSLFPGTCGYKSETGGMLKDIRTLDIDTIRKYHKNFYRSDNLCLVIVGKVDAAEVFKSLEPIVHKIAASPARTMKQRPWSSPVPPFEASREDVVQFPSDEEETGLLFIGWRGPDWSDFETRCALEVLWEYLTQTSLAPLQKSLVECEEPFCSDVGAGSVAFKQTVFYLSLSGTKTAKMDSVVSVIQETLKATQIDAERIQRVIAAERRDILSKLDREPEEIVTSLAIEGFLYAPRDDASVMKNQFNMIHQLQSLTSKPMSYWQSLLQDWILCRPSAVVKGIPSAAMVDQLADEEESRVQKQKEALGPAKLELLGETLVKSEEANAAGTPDDVLERFPVPKDPIQFIPVSTYRALDGKNSILSDALRSLGLPFQIDHVATPFITLRLFLDTSSLDESTRKLLPLYTSLLFDSPMDVDGKRLSSDDIAALLEQDAVSYSATVGSGGGNLTIGSFGQYVQVSLKFLAEKYDTAVSWVERVLFGLVMDEKRVRVNANRLLGDIERIMRSGSTISSIAAAYSMLDIPSNHRACTFVQQQSVLQHALDNPAATVSQLGTLHRTFQGPQRILFHLVCNTALQSDLIAPWKQFSGTLATSKPFPSTVLSRSFLRPVDSWSHSILQVGGCESSYLARYTPCSLAMTSSEYSKLAVLLEYLTTLEGPFWKRIRGMGLAYGYGLRIVSARGVLMLTLYRCTNVVDAFLEAKRVVEELQDPSLFSQVALDAAKSSYVYETVSTQSDPTSAGVASMRRTLYQLDENYTTQLLEKAKQVTLEDLSSTLAKYVLPLFDSSNSGTVLTTGTSMALPIQFSMKEKLGLDCSIHQSATFFH